ncbi:MAG TPA: hypothetical protein ENN76_03305 [Euryarchaeota archaeon]|nr:hypothetical protein [Euryarchaeota archaeon]
MALPLDLLRSRIRNEIRIAIDELQHPISVSDPSLSRFPLQLNVSLTKTPGPSIKNGQVVHRYNHRFQIHITDQYPYEKPIVRWRTPIFHPNIMPPEDGGYVCTKLLDDWSFSSNLLTFIKGVETMLANPNPANPYATETCIEAAKYFARYKYKPPILADRNKPRPRIVK